MPQNPLIDDLIQHTVARIGKAMNGAIQLVDDPDDQYAIMMGVTAAMVGSFVKSISNGSEAFEVLTEQQKLLVCMGMIMSTLGGAPSVKEMSPEVQHLLLAAERSYPRVVIG